MQEKREIKASSILLFWWKTTGYEKTHISSPYN